MICRAYLEVSWLLYHIEQWKHDVQCAPTVDGDSSVYHYS